MGHLSLPSCFDKASTDPESPPVRNGKAPGPRLRLLPCEAAVDPQTGQVRLTKGGAHAGARRLKELGRAAQGDLEAGLQENGRPLWLSPARPPRQKSSLVGGADEGAGPEGGTSR